MDPGMSNQLLRRVRSWIVMFAAALAAPATAQQQDSSVAIAAPGDSGPARVTLEQAIRRALQVQPSMIQAQGDRRNASAGERTAFGAFLPTVSASATRNQASANRFNPTTSEIVTGGASVKSYAGGVTLDFTVFDGPRRFAARRAAGATSDAADASITSQRFQVTLQTTQLFYGALADEELVDVATAQVARATRQFQISVQKLHAGQATRSDSLRARVDLGNARLTLLQAQANLETARSNLGRQVGSDRPVRAALDSVFPEPPDTAALREEVVRSAPLVIQAAAQSRAADAKVVVAQAQYWPTLSATFANGISGFDAPWTTFNSYVNNWSLKLTLSLPLFDGFAREQAQVTARVARDIAEAQAADARRAVGAQLTQQLAALETAHAQIDIARENVASATEDLRVLQERYRVGASTILDILISQANLTQAETSVIQARFGYLIARAQLEALVGHPL
jgi:outer membrane protein